MILSLKNNNELALIFCVMSYLEELKKGGREKRKEEEEEKTSHEHNDDVSHVCFSSAFLLLSINFLFFSATCKVSEYL